jgi:hypothetical protein
MALKKCKECGQQISDAAKACPQCGAPQKKNVGCILWIIAMVVVLGLAAKMNFKNKASDDLSSRNHIVEVDKSPVKQREREQFINKLINQGIFAKVEKRSTFPRLWIKPAFYSLEFKEKEGFVSVVYAYYFDGNNFTDTIVLMDNLTGKRVGNYSLSNPGLKME